MNAVEIALSKKWASIPQRVDGRSIRAVMMAALAGLIVAPWVSKPIANDLRSVPLGVSFASQKKGKLLHQEHVETAWGAAVDIEAIGSAETKITLGSLVNLHHNEIVPLSDTEPTAESWAHFLRDRVTGQVGKMDLRLLGLVREVAKDLAQQDHAQTERGPLHFIESPMKKSMKPAEKKRENDVERSGVNATSTKADDTEPMRIEFVSGYRYWKFNEMLRKKGRNVASESQHTAGKAIDFRVQGVDTLRLRDAINALEWAGGMGYYPGKSDQFVHVDTGAKRRWQGK